MPRHKTQTLIAKEAKFQRWSQLPDNTFEQARVKREAAIKLEYGAHFKLVWPWDSEYEKDRQEYNPAFQEYPLLIGYPETPGDVAWLLDFSRQIDPPLPVVCRSGGHSTAGYSVVTDGIVIDMSLFNSVSIDPVKRLAAAGAGVKFKKLNKIVEEYGLHVPGGDCEDVCIAGFMQGGGYGLTSREFGINCDNVVQFTMLTYDSDGAHIVVASADKNPRLFWAVRGGTGNNFGVLLDITYQLHPLGIMWGFFIKWPDLKNAPVALLAMQDRYMKEGASPKLGHSPGIMVLAKDTQPSLSTYGLYDGPRAEGLAAIRALLAIGNATLTQDQSGTYRELINTLSPDPHLPPGVNSFPPEVKQSAYISQPIDLSGWTEIVNYYSKRPNDTDAIFTEPYGGAISRYPANGNAFIHRDAYMDIFVDSFWFHDGEKMAAEEWLDGYMAILAKYSNGQQYQNYPHRNTPNYAEAFWGSVYPVLQKVKAEYDPSDVFQFPMGIRPPDRKEGAEAAIVVESHFEKYREERSRVRD